MTPQKDTLIQIKRLAQDHEYYTNVFKKTEKAISVVFYILSHINTTKDREFHIEILKDRALKTHAAALQTLRLQEQEASEGLINFQYSLVDLESTIRVAEAAGVIPQNITSMLFEQIITIERYLGNHFITATGIDFSADSLLEGSKTARLPKAVKFQASNIAPATQRRRPVNIPTNDISSDAYFVYSQLTDRAERIKTVLEAKPQATIRDIAEIITDVSEKTIQRELNSLIEKGQVIREGERRWSRYSVNK